MIFAYKTQKAKKKIKIRTNNTTVNIQPCWLLSVVLSHVSFIESINLIVTSGQWNPLLKQPSIASNNELT